jgi:hypothetical protein
MSDQKPTPPVTPGAIYDPGWDSGLSGRLGGQGFMGAPPPRNPPPEPDEGAAKGEDDDEDFPRDRDHLTEADQKGESGPKEPAEPTLERPYRGPRAAGRRPFSL